MKTLTIALALLLSGSLVAPVVVGALAFAAVILAADYLEG